MAVKAHNQEFTWGGPISKRHRAMMAGDKVQPYVDPVAVTEERREREERRRRAEDRKLAKELLGSDPY